MPKRTDDFDSWQLEKLSDPARATRYLSTILEEAPEQFIAGLGNVARAHHISTVAEKAGTARETLYRSLSDEGNPTWKMLNSVMKVLQLKFIGIEQTTRASTEPRHNLSATRTARRRRTIASRSNRSYSSASTQLAFSFPAENANVILKAGEANPLAQVSTLATYSAFSWASPAQQPKEGGSAFELNAMLATINQPQYNEIRGRV